MVLGGDTGGVVSSSGGAGNALSVIELLLGGWVVGVGVITGSGICIVDVGSVNRAVSSSGSGSMALSSARALATCICCTSGATSDFDSSLRFASMALALAALAGNVSSESLLASCSFSMGPAINCGAAVSSEAGLSSLSSAIPSSLC